MTDAVADALARFGLPMILLAVAQYGPKWSRDVREWMDRRDRRRSHNDLAAVTSPVDETQPS